MNIAFLGQKPVGTACLKLLAGAVGSSQISLVCSNSVPYGWWNDSDIWDFARSLKIETRCSIEMKSQDLERILIQKEITHIICVQSSVIISPLSLSFVRENAYNLHLAPLPQYMGWHSASHAILNQDIVFGTTIHRMVEAVDEGPIVLRNFFELHKDFDVGRLYRESEKAGVSLFRNFLELLKTGNFSAVEQKGLQRFYRKESLSSRLECEQIPESLWRLATQFKYFKTDLLKLG